jgi:hypothetical protein
MAVKMEKKFSAQRSIGVFSRDYHSSVRSRGARGPALMAQTAAARIVRANPLARSFVIRPISRAPQAPPLAPCPHLPQKQGHDRQAERTAR